MAVWPNGLKTRPTLSSLWKEYSGVYAKDHWGFDTYGFRYNCAIAAGVIVKIGYNTFGGGGHEVYLKLDGSGDIILYYHNAADLLVVVGQRVVAGQRLGIQSNSGKTYGIHLHLEVWLGGYRSRRTDPLPYITKLVGTSPASDSSTPLPTMEESANMRSIKHATTGEHTLVGEFTTTKMNSAFANDAAQVWNADKQHEVLDDASYKRVTYLAEEQGRKLHLAMANAAEAAVTKALAGLPVSSAKVPTAKEIAIAFVAEMKLPGN